MLDLPKHGPPRATMRVWLAHFHHTLNLKADCLPHSNRYVHLFCFSQIEAETLPLPTKRISMQNPTVRKYTSRRVNATPLRKLHSIYPAGIFHLTSSHTHLHRASSMTSLVLIATILKLSPESQNHVFWHPLSPPQALDAVSQPILWFCHTRAPKNNYMEINSICLTRSSAKNCHVRWKPY